MDGIACGWLQAGENARSDQLEAAAGVDDEDDDELDEAELLDELDDEESDDLLDELSDDELELDDSPFDDELLLELFEVSRLSVR